VAVIELFSTREKRKQRAGQEDVYQYDNLPAEFRVQVVHIWNDALGGAEYFRPGAAWWQKIYTLLIREKGVFQLAPHGENAALQCVHYLLNSATIDALDLIELSFRFVDVFVRRLSRDERQHYKLVEPDEGISELNSRFKAHGIGYEYDSGKLVRVDSRYLHAEAVKPALHLLRDSGKVFAGPLDEYLRAHERYRKGEQKEAIAEALKAFESTMKAICTVRNWPFDPHKDTAKQLIGIILNKGLIPSYLQQQFNGLASVLESGVPTVRNKTSGHGQGATPTTVPDYLASYALHLAASNIVLLVEAHKAMP